MAQFGYTANYSSLMELAGLLSNEQFSQFMNDVVYPYRQGGPRITEGFTQLPLKPAINMTYAALQTENNVGIMANHVALEAHAKPTPTKGFSGLEGTIPHVATNMTLGQEDYLKAAKTLMEAEMVGTPLQQAAQMMLYEKFDSKLQEHDDRASYMRDYVVFNGKYDITQDNNDGSFTDVTFDFKVPAANKKTLTTTSRWWTDNNHQTEGADANPVKDIDDILLEMQSKGIRRDSVVIEIGFYTLNRLCRHSKVRSDIALFMNPALAGVNDEEKIKTTLAMSDNQLQRALESRLGVSFIVRDFITSMPKFNKTTGKFEFAEMTGFKEDVLVFRPKGNIGEIHSSGHLTVGGDAGSNGVYGMFDGGRILMTYTCNVRERIQIWDTEETSLYVLTAGKNMRYLTVK